METFEKIPYRSEKYKQALSLRESILRAPLGLEFSEDDLTGEGNQLHFGLFNGDEITACVTLKPVNATEMKLRQMAVAPEQNGKGLGRRLITESEAHVLSEGYTTISMAARESAIKFYEKLGYRTVGQLFTEVGIKHIRMEKYLIG